MTAPIDVSMMDFLLQKDDAIMKINDNNFNIKHEIDLDLPGFVYNNSEDNFINDVWPSNPDEFLDSILNDGGQLEGVLDPSPNCPSDSGLSSENAEIEFEDQFHDDEILSSTMSSPGPSISEVGIQSSPVYSDEGNLPDPKSEIVYPEYQTSTVNLQQVANNNVLSPKNNQQRSSNSKPLQTVTILNQKNLQTTKLTGKVIRIQSMPGNPRSILLPVSVKDLRTIKIINAPNAKKTNGTTNATPVTLNNIKLTSANLLQHSKKVTLKNNVLYTQAEETSSNDTIDMTTSTSDEEQFDGSNSETSANGSSGYPRLQLTIEEQRLLAKEGITLPTSYPLTKHEERELKRIRRKIRNKISAQDSRKRKKEYVDGLEDRVKQCTEENQTLLKRIKLLQTQNQSLVSQLRRLQALVSRKVGGATGNTGIAASGAAIGKAQPATCLMVLLLSLALIAVPSLKRNDPNSTDLRTLDSDLENKDEYIGKRALLFKPGEDNIDDDLNMEDLLTFHSDLNGHSSSSPAKKARMAVEPHFDDLSLDGFPKSPQYNTGSNGSGDGGGGSDINRKYLEPPLDDTWPLSGNNILHTSDNGHINFEKLHNATTQQQANNVVILHVPEDQ